jgi:hypothetical protein
MTVILSAPTPSCCTSCIAQGCEKGLGFELSNYKKRKFFEQRKEKMEAGVQPTVFIVDPPL